MIRWESSMNFFFPLTEKTPTPADSRQVASLPTEVESRKLSSSGWTSRSTFGISMLGGLLLFIEEEGATIVVEDKLPEIDIPAEGRLTWAKVSSEKERSNYSIEKTCMEGDEEER